MWDGVGIRPLWGYKLADKVIPEVMHKSCKIR